MTVRLTRIGRNSKVAHVYSPPPTTTTSPMETTNCSHCVTAITIMGINPTNEARPRQSQKQLLTNAVVRRLSGLKSWSWCSAAGGFDCCSFMCRHFSTQHRDCASNFHHWEHRLGFETNAVLVHICPGRCISLLVAQCRFGNGRREFLGTVSKLCVGCYHSSTPLWVLSGGDLER